MSDSEHQGRWKAYGERPIYENFWTTVTLLHVDPPGQERFEHHVVRLHRCAGVVVLDEAGNNVLMLYRQRFRLAARSRGHERARRPLSSSRFSRASGLPHSSIGSVSSLVQTGRSKICLSSCAPRRCLA